MIVVICGLSSSGKTHFIKSDLGNALVGGVIGAGAHPVKFAHEFNGKKSIDTGGDYVLHYNLQRVFSFMKSNEQCAFDEDPVWQLVKQHPTNDIVFATLVAPTQVIRERIEARDEIEENDDKPYPKEKYLNWAHEALHLEIYRAFLSELNASGFRYSVYDSSHADYPKLNDFDAIKATIERKNGAVA